MWLHLELIARMAACCRGLFPAVAYGRTAVPTYPSGAALSSPSQ
jgi:spermidine synthase